MAIVVFVYFEFISKHLRKSLPILQSNWLLFACKLAHYAIGPLCVLIYRHRTLLLQVEVDYVLIYSALIEFFLDVGHLDAVLGMIWLREFRQLLGKERFVN